MKTKPPKSMYSFRLTTECHDYLYALADAWGVSMTDVLHVIIRERAKREGIELEKPETD